MEPVFAELLKAKLVDAIPYVVGGVLAIGGGILGNALTHVFTARRDRRNYLRDQLAEYTHLLSEDAAWLDRKRQSYCFGDATEPDSQEPWDRAFAISTLYFQLGAVELPFIKARAALIQAIYVVGMQRRQIVAEGKAASLILARADAQLVTDVVNAYAAYYEAEKNISLACRELSAPWRS